MVIPLIATAWLAVCAWFDWQSRQISNWLTIPPLLLAGVFRLAGWANGPPGWILVVFLLCLAGWSIGWIGGADVKVTLALVMLDPSLSGWAWGGAILLAVLWRLSRRRVHRLPGLVGFLIGLVLYLLVGGFL